MNEDRNLLIFSGNANRPLAQAVCRELGVRPGKALVSTFSDGELQVEIEENVRRQDVFVIQPVRALRRAPDGAAGPDRRAWRPAASVTAVVPYFGYARQDRRMRSRGCRSPPWRPRCSPPPARRLLTVDLHADQIQGFFESPVDTGASPLADIWRGTAPAT